MYNMLIGAVMSCDALKSISSDARHCQLGLYTILVRCQDSRGRSDLAHACCGVNDFISSSHLCDCGAVAYARISNGLGNVAVPLVALVRSPSPDWQVKPVF